MKTYLYRFCKDGDVCYDVQIIAEATPHNGFQNDLELVVLHLGKAKTLFHFETVQAHNRHEAQARAEAACGVLVRTN